MVIRPCEQCGKSMKCYPSSADRRCCSAACLYALREADEVPRFWRSVDKTDTCWLWNGTCQLGGYGIFTTHQRKKVTVHRYSFTLANGTIPDDMLICHHCDVPPCIRPDHLYAGTPKDNSRDMIERGRANTNVAGNRAVLTEDEVRAIRRRYGPPRGNAGYQSRFVEPTAKQLGSEFGVSKETVIAIVNRRCWKGLTD
jgi:hypothetical protein